MRVFISWSGELSKKVAQQLGSWIEDVLQGTKSWISTDDIDKGSIWFSDITSQLSDTSIGIICLTSENLNSPWILFEAGCLSKGLTKSRVCPFLVNLNHSDLTPPLSQFNGTLPNHDDVLKLLKTINTQNGESALTTEKLEKAFARWWPEFDTAYKEIIRNYKPSKPNQRPMQEMIAEILEISRSIQRQMQRIDIREENQKIVENVLGLRRKPALNDFLAGEGIISDKAINEVVEEYNKRMKSFNQIINSKENLESDSATKGESS